MNLEALEKQVILKAFRFYNNNKTATANSLGISIRTLDTKLERYAGEELVEQERMDRERAHRAEQLERARGNPPNNIGIPYSPQAFIHQTASGLRMESIANSTEKPGVSVPERSQVQEVLPKSNPHGSSKRGR